MAFHHDIVRLNDGSILEFCHTQAQCLERGWLSPQGYWLRKFVDYPDSKLTDDPLFGERLYTPR